MAKKKASSNETPKTGTLMDGTVPLIGVVYSTETNLKTIRANEVRHHGSAAERINEASDFRIKNRIYLKLKKGDKLPTKGIGEGDHAYIAMINGVFNIKTASEDQMLAIQEEMSADDKETDEDNKFESALLSKGYTGYLSGDIIVVLDTNVKVKKYESAEENNEPLQAPEVDVAQNKKELPKSTTKRKLTKKEASSLSDILPALQSKAPSTTIKGGVLSVNDDEYDSFLKEASTFPNMPKFITDAAVGDDEDTNRHTAFRAKKISRQKQKRIADKQLADTIKKILLDDTFTKNFSGKVSETFKNFESASKAYIDNRDENKPDDSTSSDLSGSDDTNELLEDIRDILTVIADETIAENGIAKEDAKERLQDILEQTKGKSDEQSQYLTKTLNQVLTEIRTSETEEHLDIKSKEPLSKRPSFTKTSTDTMTTEDVEDFSNVETKQPVRPELSPEVIKEATKIVDEQKISTAEPKVDQIQQIEKIAKELGIEPQQKWQDTLVKIEEVVVKQKQQTIVPDSDVVSNDDRSSTTPTPQSTVSVPDLTSTNEPSNSVDSTKIEPKEATQPKLSPEVVEAAKTVVERQKNVVSIVKERVDELAKELGIEPETKWEDTLVKVEQVVVKQKQQQTIVDEELPKEPDLEQSTITPKEATQPKLSPEVVETPKEPTQPKLSPEAIDNAVRVIERQKNVVSIVKERVEDLAKTMGIEPESNWQDTLGKIEQVTTKQNATTGANEKLEPKQTTSPDLSPIDNGMKDTETVSATKTPTPIAANDSEQPQQTDAVRTDAVQVEPKELVSPDIRKPVQDEKNDVTKDKIEQKQSSKPAYQADDEEDWDTPLRLTPEQVKEREKKKQQAEETVAPKEAAKPELTPVEKEMQHSKEVGETVPKFKKPDNKTTKPIEIKTRPSPPPRRTYRPERTVEDEATGIKTKTPAYTPIPHDTGIGGALLGSYFNNDRDIVTTDKDGKEISRRAGANKIDYAKLLVRKGDEFLGRGGTMGAIRLLKGKKKKVPPKEKPPANTTPPDNDLTPKQADTTKNDGVVEAKGKTTPSIAPIEPDQPTAKKGTMTGMSKRKFIRMADKIVGRGTGRSILEAMPKKERTKPAREVSKFDRQKPAPEKRQSTAPEPKQQADAPITPVAPVAAEENSSILSDLASAAGARGTGLLGKGKALLSKAGKFAGKIAAPLAAGASIYGGISDIAEGGKVESVSDIIPKGGILDKVNPFNYVMNAGRFVGDKWNKGYEAVSGAVGGSGSLGSDVYDLVNGKPKDANMTPLPPPKANINQTIKPKSIVPSEIAVKPKLPAHELKPETEQLAESGMEKDIAKAEQSTSINTPTNIVSNVTNNSTPTQQVMPSNMMHQRNNENAYQAMNNRKFSL